MSPPDSESSGLLEVGYIGKAHGLKGDVLVVFTTNRLEERARPGSRMWADERLLEIEHIKSHKDRWIVGFAGVTLREAADELRGTTLTAEPVEDHDALFVHKLIGCEVVDGAGNKHGTVVSVLANPASDILELDNAKLVPLAFYVSHDDATIVVDAPPGLLDGATEDARPEKG